MTERITSRKNPFLQQVKKLLTSKKERQNTGLFVADGTKLLQEAVRWYHGLDTVILSDGVEAELPDYVRLIRVWSIKDRLPVNIVLDGELTVDYLLIL